MLQRYGSNETEFCMGGGGNLEHLTLVVRMYSMTDKKLNSVLEALHGSCFIYLKKRKIFKNIYLLECIQYQT